MHCMLSRSATKGEGFSLSSPLMLIDAGTCTWCTKSWTPTCTKSSARRSRSAVSKVWVTGGPVVWLLVGSNHGALASHALQQPRCTCKPQLPVIGLPTSFPVHTCFCRGAHPILCLPAAAACPPEFGVHPIDSIIPSDCRGAHPVLCLPAAARPQVPAHRGAAAGCKALAHCT